MSKTPPPRPASAPLPTKAPWRVDGCESAQPSPTAALSPRFVSAPAPPPPPPLAVAADSPPSDAAERIRASAAKGGNLKALHALFGVTSEVLKGWMDADPELRKGFDEGKEQERESLHRTIYDAAIYKRDLPAAQFLLKTRHGYREQEAEDTRNSVRIVFNLPAAAPDVQTYIEQNGKREAEPLPRAPRVIDHE